MFIRLATGLVVMGRDSRSRGVSSNPGIGYWMDIFLHKIVMSEKRLGMAHF